MTPVFRHHIGADLDLAFTCTPDVGVAEPDWTAWTMSLVLYHPPTQWVVVVPGAYSPGSGEGSFRFFVSGAAQADWPADFVLAELQGLEADPLGVAKPLRTEPVRIMLIPAAPAPAPLTDYASEYALSTGT
jgi:hypothetical protein